jgi:multidrug efflux pump
VQAAINAAGNLLPSDLPAPPIYAKVNPADAPILTLAVTSKTMPLTQVEDLADTRLAQKISQLPGVGLVSISGGQRPGGAHPGQSPGAGRLRPEHRRSAHHHRQRQRQHAQGQFRRAAQAYTINANDQLQSAADYAT